MVSTFGLTQRWAAWAYCSIHRRCELHVQISRRVLTKNSTSNKGGFIEVPRGNRRRHFGCDD